jgi:hypothetical protein
MTVEELIDYDKNNLTDHKLIYSKMGNAWYWFYTIAMLLAIMIFIFPILLIFPAKNPNYLWLLISIPSFFIFFILVKYFRKKTLPILEDYTNKFNLNLKVNWLFFKDRKIISNIQYLVLANYLTKNNIKFSKEDISKIIEALKFERSITRYNYQSLTIIIAFLTILTSAFLGSWLRIGTNIDELSKIAIKCALGLLVISIAIFEIEEFFVKDIIRSRRNRYQRLIRVLENYSINL